METEKEILDLINQIGPWAQILTLPNGITTPGRWNAKEQALFLMENSPFSLKGSILDVGGNSGGIAINLQTNAGKLVVLEIGKKYLAQFNFLAKYVNTSKVEFINDSLFTMHKLGKFDVVLALGLVYHFRHPQLFLDYCSGIECSNWVFSTQTTTDDKSMLTNMSEIPNYKGRGLLGWYPSKLAIKQMLKAAGFIISKEVSINAAANGFTNNYYIFCSKENIPEVNLDAIQEISKSKNFWF